LSKLTSAYDALLQSVTDLKADIAEMNVTVNRLKLDDLAGAPHVRAYWERLFDAVGVGSVVFD
jgi:hypothetical protein